MSLIEGAASSMIEGYVSNLPTLAAHLAGGQTDTQAGIIAVNVDGIAQALDKSGQPFREDALLSLHSTVLPQPVKLSGKIRDFQVWIAGMTPVTAVSVPPPWEHVRDCLEDWYSFLAREDLPPVEHIALSHAQFESIHPFGDGNGRTGRAVAMWQMKAKGLPVVPLSSVLYGCRQDYYSALRAYKEGDCEPVVSLFAGAVSGAAEAMCEFTGEFEALTGAIRSDLGSLEHGGVLADIFAEHGAATSAGLAEAAGISKADAEKAMCSMDSPRLFRETSQASEVWLCPEYFDIAYKINDHAVASRSPVVPEIDTRALSWRSDRLAARRAYPVRPGTQRLLSIP